jgi:hypothetical protein
MIFITVVQQVRWWQLAATSGLVVQLVRVVDFGSQLYNVFTVYTHLSRNRDDVTADGLNVNDYHSNEIVCR